MVLGAACAGDADNECQERRHGGAECSASQSSPSSGTAGRGPCHPAPAIGAKTLALVGASVRSAGCGLRVRLGCGDRTCRQDQREMAERLREVADLTLTADVVLLGQ